MTARTVSPTDGRAKRTRGRSLRADLVLAAVGLLVLACSALPVSSHSVPAIEVDVFRVVNDLPGSLFAPVWVVMQLGSLLAVPLAALAALAARRARLAGALLLAGVTAYLVAKVIKASVERGRPGELLDEVDLRGAAADGFGYASGHSAVAAALAAVAATALPRRWRAVVIGLAVVVAISRLYVGAHLPLDVIGGAALGVAAAGLALAVTALPWPRARSARR